MKKALPHIIAIIIMLVASCAYFAPALSGDIVMQGDIQKSEAMAHQQKMAADSTGTIPNWNPGMFSGMPGYQTAVEPQHSIFTPLKSILIMRPLGLERNVGMLWLYLIGFYVAMIAFGCSPWLALLGAVSFGLGSYNIIIVEAGHITKGWAMSMMAPILASMVLSLRATETDGEGKRRIRWRQLVWGAILFTISAGLQITFNHIQITYYTLLCGVIIGITYLVYALREKWAKQFFTIVGILVVGGILAAGSNYRHLTVNQEYVRYTMRGGNELTVTPSSQSTSTEASESKGLDIDYAFSWSYGIGETYTILVPGAMGGGSNERLPEDSQWASRTGQHNGPLYWGDQPFTSGPVYFGAIIIFLFLFGCFVVKGPERWWLIIAAVVSIVLSWGRHCMPINEFLFNHLPLYNKFRTPSMFLVLTNVVMVIMATLSLREITRLQEGGGSNNQALKQSNIQAFNRALYISGGIIGGIILIGMILAKTKLSFVGSVDEQYSAMAGDQWPMLQQLLIDDRRALFMRDSWRSLIFVALAFGSIWLYINQKIKKGIALIGILTVLILIDLWGVDRRYLNSDNFVAPERVALHRTPAEQQLDQIAAANGDYNYRIYDMSVNTFNDSRPSAFHNQIGGYHPAKLRRYQDLIDFYLNNQSIFSYVNRCQIGANAYLGDTPLLTVRESHPVLDMLNARYIIVPFQNGQNAQPVRRTSAAGNCWLVSEVNVVDDANAEILALNDFNPLQTAIVNKDIWPSTAQLNDYKTTQIDSTETITLVRSHPQDPDHLTYSSHTLRDHVALFSEVYYAPDWRAYIDGKPVDHFRADYILRAIILPAGDHKIEFINEAPTLHRNDSITLIISIFMLLMMAGALFLVYRKKS